MWPSFAEEPETTRSCWSREGKGRPRCRHCLWHRPLGAAAEGRLNSLSRGMQAPHPLDQHALHGHEGIQRIQKSDQPLWLAALSACVSSSREPGRDRRHGTDEGWPALHCRAPSRLGPLETARVAMHRTPVQYCQSAGPPVHGRPEGQTERTTGDEANRVLGFGSDARRLPSRPQVRSQPSPRSEDQLRGGEFITDRVEKRRGEAKSGCPRPSLVYAGTGAPRTPERSRNRERRGVRENRGHSPLDSRLFKPFRRTLSKFPCVPSIRRGRSCIRR